VFGAFPACEDCVVSNNRIKRFAGNGIVAEAAEGTGTLYLSSISGNEVKDNGNDGILMELSRVPVNTRAAETSEAYNSDNALLHNEAEGNHNYDCEDDTTGSMTAGTANIWFNNIGSLSSPRGLCTLGKWHDHD
jgi:hypothetical protein